MTITESGSLPAMTTELHLLDGVLDDAIDHLAGIIAAHVSIDPAHFADSTRDAARALLGDLADGAGDRPLAYGDRVMWRMPRHGTWVHGRIERTANTARGREVGVRWDRDTAPVELRGKGLMWFTVSEHKLRREPTPPTSPTTTDRETPDA